MDALLTHGYNFECFVGMFVLAATICEFPG